MNNGSRISYFLSEEEVVRIGDAFDYASRIERPLNLAVNINLAVAEVKIRPQLFVEHFLKHAGDWLRSVGVDRLYVWVLENRGGVHVHIMIHVPKQHIARFRQLEKGWLKKAGGVNRKRAIKSESLLLLGEPHGGNKGGSRLAAFTALYILKGASIQTCQKYGIDYDHRGEQGAIIGKRCGTSNSLSERIRAKSALPEIPPFTVAPFFGPRRTPHSVFPKRPMSREQQRAYDEADREWNDKPREPRARRSSLAR